MKYEVIPKEQLACEVNFSDLTCGEGSTYQIKGSNLISAAAEFLDEMLGNENLNVVDIKEILKANQGKNITLKNNGSLFYIRLKENTIEITDDSGLYFWNFETINLMLEKKESKDFISSSLRKNNLEDFGIIIENEEINIPEGYMVGSKQFKFTSLKECDYSDSDMEPYVETVGCFENCSFFKKINLPDTITTIGCSSFLNCENLETITAKGIEEIDWCAFKNCVNLKEITLPKTLHSIDYQAFAGCIKLTNIEIPESVVRINSEVFKNCINLTTVKWNSPIVPTKELVADIFNGCINLKEINFKGKIIQVDNLVKSEEVR